MDIVFDVGATNLRLAGSVDGREFATPRVVPTPASPEAVVALLAELALEVADGTPIGSVAGGVTRKISLTAEDLARRLGCPVYLENDAALAGLGEAVVGAGQDTAILVYLTISSGIGGARIVNRKIDASRQGFEPGYQILNYLEPGKTFEDLVSGRAVEALLGQPPRTVTDRDFWLERSRLAAYGLYNAILHWSPDLVVVGGSMLRQPGIDLIEVEKTVCGLLKIFPVCPSIRPAALGDFGGLHGALELLRQKKGF